MCTKYVLKKERLEINMKKYIKAKELLESNANKKEKKPIYATRKLSIGLVSCMLGLVMATPMVHAEGEEANLPSLQVEEPAAGEENTSQESVVEELLTDEEIQDIRNRTNSLENDYFFNGNMVEELKAELRKAKADPSVNYEEAKARLIKEAIIKNTPAQKSPGEDRAVKNFNIKDADKLEAGMTVINVRGNGMETGQIIEVLVNNVVKGTFTQPKYAKSSVKITLSEA